MSAVKIILKRSSIPGKRPNSQLLEAGELGLNTNAVEPGIYFETNNGDIVKAGPTAYLSEPPTVTPAKGESWVDSDTKVLSVGTDTETWQPIASPFLGGTNGYTVFVAPDYEYATDSLKNDGQAVPFVTLNRALIEISKQYVASVISGSLFSRRFTIVLANGQHSLLNGPGTSLADFNVNFENGDDSSLPLQSVLEQFNYEDGGLVLPGGVSIIGLDQKKTVLRPSYIPKYTHPLFPADYQLTTTGPIYTAQPITSVFRWTGASYISSLSVEDKFVNRDVTSIKVGPTGLAIFQTLEAHNLSNNDVVYVSYSSQAIQQNSTFIPGVYYASPIDSKTFYLSSTSLVSSGTTSGVFTGVPVTDFSTTLRIDTTGQLLSVDNIYPYYRPLNNVDYFFSNYSAHRLSLFANISTISLDQYYTKIQRAFPEFFGGRVNSFIAQPYETEIVAPTNTLWPRNLTTNRTSTSSPYIDKINIRSSYGLSAVNFDGVEFTGFKSCIANEVTCVSLQQDPVAYEVYSDQANEWQTLTLNVGTTLNAPITAVPVPDQLQVLNETQIVNIRYYYETLRGTDGLSYGITNPDQDFRHFGFRISGSGSYAQLNSIYTIGCGVGIWSVNGSIVSLTNSTTNFGSIAFLSEGFAGIGTKEGALPNQREFSQDGIYLPLALTEFETRSDAQKNILPLGSVALYADLDPEDTTNTQRIFLSGPFDPVSILPYSLAPGTAVHIQTATCVYRAYFVTDGTETVILSSPDTPCGGAILRVRSWDSQVPVGDLNGIPYIRRYVDPRAEVDRNYGLLVTSTGQTTQSPQEGSLMRLNLTSQNQSQTIKRDKQFDPGQYGGFAQTFVVAGVETLTNALSPNYNNKISDASQSSGYVVFPGLVDYGTPWTQVVTDANGNTSYKQATGNYNVFNDKNYYASENDSWECLYYRGPNTYSTTEGPAKSNPGDENSPWVVSNPLFQSIPVSQTYQGVNGDPIQSFYAPNNIDTPGYLRGCTPPLREVTLAKAVDIDDGTNSLGIIYRKIPTTNQTVLSIDTLVYQTPQDISFPPGDFSNAGVFSRPTIVEFTVSNPLVIRDPREGPSVIRLESADGLTVEYMRVVLAQNSFYRAIRNYYPQYSLGDLPNQWTAGTKVVQCAEGIYPEPSEYDPEWSYTKFTIYRYYSLMGYPPNVIQQFLKPQPFGLRKVLNTSLTSPLPSGYANYSVSWPIEFNNPSTVIANTHSWQYAGYFDYSRGLPKYQTTDLPRKLSYDFLGSVIWGGKLTVAGVVSDGDLVFLGPVKEAQTGNFYLNENPELNFSNRTFYQSPVPVRYPKQVQVFNCDDFSSQFDGVRTVFELREGGIAVPPSKLLAKSMFVNLGGVQQQPGISYAIQDSDIVFTAAPAIGATVSVKVITTEDGEQSMTVIPLTLEPTPDGTVRLFNLDLPLVYFALPFEQENLFVTMGGIQQKAGPSQGGSYVLGENAIGRTIFFNEAPEPGVTVDIRAFTTGPIIADGQTIRVITLDDISFFFDGSREIFPLNSSGEFVNPNLVTTQSTIVELGGVIQEAGVSYTIDNSRITFVDPPEPGATAEIRVILSNSNLFLACPNPPEPYSNA